MSHILKDSGNREEFESGMVRDTREGKGRYDLVSPIALRRLALVYERGAVKYDARNWEKGSPMSRFLDSAERHLNEYKLGMRDEDHLAQAAWNIFCMIHFEELRPDLDDLPRYLDKDGEKKEEEKMGTHLEVQPEASLDREKAILEGLFPPINTTGGQGSGPF